MILHITRAEHIDGHRIHVWFNDHSDGEINLAGDLEGPIFQPLKSIDYFKRFKLEGHTVAWDNGADFAPEYLHAKVLQESRP